MILKIKQNGNWTFIDNITDCTMIMEDSFTPSGFVSYARNGEILSQNVSEGCYLLNDQGKTVQKICDVVDVSDDEATSRRMN